MLFTVIFCFICVQKVHFLSAEQAPITLKLNQTRRILRGNKVDDTRPYMVYLRPAPSSNTKPKSSNWLCGGVIIHPQYILTSAACIEDVNHFYVVSGTHRWLPLGEEDECIRNGAKKAIWKCVPKGKVKFYIPTNSYVHATNFSTLDGLQTISKRYYVFDGKDFDNIRWMINDIAVVKVDEEFNFERRIRGCDFVPKMISYNNRSETLEAPGTVASIAGWGSIDRFGDTFGRSTMNSPDLLETEVILISKKKCKRQWPERYHYIIDENMVCAKDGVDSDSMSALCKEHEIDCKELVYSDEEEEEEKAYAARRFMLDPNKSQIHSSGHNDTRRSKSVSGGFCENDHGGPLVVGHGKSSIVIGVISACMTANITQKCYGPFLYTSVWRNRHVISCAIEKDIGSTCRKLLRSLRTRMIETNFDWPSLREGPEVPFIQKKSTSKKSSSAKKHVKVRDKTENYKRETK